MNKSNFREGHSWASIVQPERGICAYKFMNTFFRLEEKDDMKYRNNEDAMKMRLTSLLKTRRLDAFWPWYLRTKCIYDMNYLEVPGKNLFPFNYLWIQSKHLGIALKIFR